jgi:hypothetical protein
VHSYCVKLHIYSVDKKPVFQYAFILHQPVRLFREYRAKCSKGRASVPKCISIVSTCTFIQWIKIKFSNMHLYCINLYIYSENIEQNVQKVIFILSNCNVYSDDKEQVFQSAFLLRQHVRLFRR